MTSTRNNAEIRLSPRRQGWLSWCRQALWNVSQRNTTEDDAPASDRAREARKTPGTFFPLWAGRAPYCSSSGGSSITSRMTSMATTQETSRSRQERGGDVGGAGNGGDEEGENKASPSLGRSARGGGSEKQLQLSRRLSSVWLYMREEEGWHFVDSSSWKVQSPLAVTTTALSVARDRSESTGQGSRPMPLTQLPAYLAGHPALYRRYETWLSKSDEGCVGAVGAPADDACHAKISEVVGETSTADSAFHTSGMAEGGCEKGAAVARKTATTVEAGASAASSSSSTARAPDPALATARQEVHVDDLSDEQTHEEEQGHGHGQTQQQRPRQGNGVVRKSSPGDPAVQSPPLPCSVAAGGGGCSGSGSGSGGDDSNRSTSGADHAEERNSLTSTPPLALRTRSRVRLYDLSPLNMRASGKNGEEAPMQAARAGGGRATRATEGSEGGGARGARALEVVDVSPPPRKRPSGTPVAAAPVASPATAVGASASDAPSWVTRKRRRFASLPGPQGSAGGGELQVAGATPRKEQQHPLPPSGKRRRTAECVSSRSTGQQQHHRTPRSSKKRRRMTAGCVSSPSSTGERQQQQPPPRPSRRREGTTPMAIAGVGATGKGADQDRRAGAATERDREAAAEISSITHPDGTNHCPLGCYFHSAWVLGGEVRHDDRAGNSMAEQNPAELLPSAFQRPRVKQERKNGTGQLYSPGHTHSAAAVDAATDPTASDSAFSATSSGGDRSSRRRNRAYCRRRSVEGVVPNPAVGAGGGGGGSGGNDRVDDPLAPYDRIERETVSDEGLEELLHTPRRDGFLDLRRYRKPGWPRPLRVTRLEASHGKRFEEHLLLLLKQKRRVEATVFLRRLAHYDRNPPHLAASILGAGARGRGHVACIPAWYQELSAAAARPSLSGSPSSGGLDGGGGDGVEELVDLAEEEVDVVECYGNEPLECVMMQVVKREPGLEEEEEDEEKKKEDVARAAGSGDCGGAEEGKMVPSSVTSISRRVKKEVG